MVPQSWFRVVISDGVQQQLKSSLVRNSVFIMSASITNSLFGYFFWVLAASAYPKAEIGIATALISAVLLIVIVSRFGLDQSLVRYLPEGNRSRIVWTSLIVTTLAALVIGVIFVIVAGLWMTDLRMVSSPSGFLIFMSFLAIYSATTMIGVVFIAVRKAKLYFLQSLVTNTKLVLLLPFVSFGVMGIFGSFGLSSAIALVLSVAIIHELGFGKLSIDKSYLADSFSFSMSNYVIGLLVSTPAQLLPLMILGMLGPADTADFYMAYAISSVLFIIPGAISTSLFVEGSHGEDLRQNVLKSFKTVIAILTPSMGLVIVFGGSLLRLIGESYVDSLGLLRIMAASSYLTIVSTMYFSIKRIQMRVRVLLYLSLAFFGALMISGYFLVIDFGLIGVGYAWILSYSLLDSIILVLAWRERWI